MYIRARHQQDTASGEPFSLSLPPWHSASVAECEGGFLDIKTIFFFFFYTYKIEIRIEMTLSLPNSLSFLCFTSFNTDLLIYSFDIFDSKFASYYF